MPHEPDHIIAVKHRGDTNAGNLAWTCFVCSRGKGSDLASVDEISGEIVRLFHPRTDLWDDHLELMEDGSLLARTAIGRVTISLLS
ncbi:MAG: HNH endonuclease [Planctomycetaceae bacterium]|nr:HNH endonuclease [Planctomycetaceae bacterium]